MVSIWKGRLPMPRMHMMAALSAAMLLSLVAQDGSAAIAKKLGKSGLSGTLSSNKAVRKQQLIADPASEDVTTLGVAGASGAPVRGSTSVRYDPSLVTLSDFVLGPGYYGDAFVEVTRGGRSQLVSFADFLEGGGTESGYVQTFFDISNGEGPTNPDLGSPGQISIARGYTQVDQDGPFGTDTHAFLFDVLDGVSDTQIIEYTVYADDGQRPTGNGADYLVGDDGDGEYRIDPPNITSATVRGSLTAIPLPAAVWMGGAMLIAVLGSGKLRAKMA